MGFSAPVSPSAAVGQDIPQLVQKCPELLLPSAVTDNGWAVRVRVHPSDLVQGQVGRVKLDQMFREVVMADSQERPQHLRMVGGIEAKAQEGVTVIQLPSSSSPSSYGTTSRFIFIRNSLSSHLHCTQVLWIRSQVCTGSSHVLNTHPLLPLKWSSCRLEGMFMMKSMALVLLVPLPWRSFGAFSFTPNSNS